MTNSNQKSLKNPKITINTNKAQITLESKHLERGILTTKTTVGGKVVNLTSTKNSKNPQLQFGFKNAVTPGNIRGNQHKALLLQTSVPTKTKSVIA